MIKAVIFDVDGTIVDSEPLHVEAWDKALQLYGHHLIDLPDEKRTSIAGKKLLVNATMMVDELHIPVSPELFMKQKTEIFMELLNTGMKPMPGLQQVIPLLKKSGYKLGVGTAGRKNYINKVLMTFNIMQYFDVIVYGDDITNGKPHPETYLTVAEKLKCKPEECVVIEDAENGITSAKAAGCSCIAIENANALKQDTSRADKVISSYEELTDKLIQSLPLDR